MHGDPVKVRTFMSRYSSAFCSAVEQDIVKTALENGINMFDEAENYTGGRSESEMCVLVLWNGRLA